MAVTSFETTKSVFDRTDENDSFSISTPGQWYPEGGGEISDKLIKLSEPRSVNNIELHVKEVEKRSN